MKGRKTSKIKKKTVLQFMLEASLWFASQKPTFDILKF